MGTINTALSNAWQGFFYSLAGSGAITKKQAMIASGLIDKAANTSQGEAIAAATTLTAEDSGKTYFLNSATGFATTLPAPAIGLNYKFVVSTQPTSGNHTVVTNGSANIIEGVAVVEGATNPTVEQAANEDSINFVASITLVGDYAEVISDGTSWFVKAASGATGGVTFTAA